MKFKTIIFIIIIIILVGVSFVVFKNVLPGATEKNSDQNNATSTVLTNIESQKTIEVITSGPLKIFKTLKNGNEGELSIEGIIYRTNNERKNIGVDTLKESKELDASALVKAQDILNRQYFEHTAPDGKTAKDLVNDAGYTFVRVGENLALGDFANDADLVSAWMNSPGHRANILDSRYQEIGVGVATGVYQGRNVLVAVQHFARPRSSCPAVEEELKTKVIKEQTDIIKMSKDLDALKQYIDSTRANGGYVDNAIINSYNNSVSKYDALVVDSENTRNKYNQEVELFNVCLISLE